MQDLDGYEFHHCNSSSLPTIRSNVDGNDCTALVLKAVSVCRTGSPLPINLVLIDIARVESYVQLDLYCKVFKLCRFKSEGVLWQALLCLIYRCTRVCVRACVRARLCVWWKEGMGLGAEGESDGGRGGAGVWGQKSLDKPYFKKRNFRQPSCCHTLPQQLITFLIPLDTKQPAAQCEKTGDCNAPFGKGHVRARTCVRACE